MAQTLVGERPETTEQVAESPNPETSDSQTVAELRNLLSQKENALEDRREKAEPLEATEARHARMQGISKGARNPNDPLRQSARLRVARNDIGEMAEEADQLQSRVDQVVEREALLVQTPSSFAVPETPIVAAKTERTPEDAARERRPSLEREIRDLQADISDLTRQKTEFERRQTEQERADAREAEAGSAGKKGRRGAKRNVKQELANITNVLAAREQQLGELQQERGRINRILKTVEPLRAPTKPVEVPEKTATPAPATAQVPDAMPPMPVERAAPATETPRPALRASAPPSAPAVPETPKPVPPEASVPPARPAAETGNPAWSVRERLNAVNAEILAAQRELHRLNEELDRVEDANQAVLGDKNALIKKRQSLKGSERGPISQQISQLQQKMDVYRKNAHHLNLKISATFAALERKRQEAYALVEERKREDNVTTAAPATPPSPKPPAPVKAKERPPATALVPATNPPVPAAVETLVAPVPADRPKREPARTTEMSEAYRRAHRVLSLQQQGITVERFASDLALKESTADFLFRMLMDEGSLAPDPNVPGKYLYVPPEERVTQRPPASAAAETPHDKKKKAKAGRVIPQTIIPVTSKAVPGSAPLPTPGDPSGDAIILIGKLPAWRTERAAMDKDTSEGAVKRKEELDALIQRGELAERRSKTLRERDRARRERERAEQEVMRLRNDVERLTQAEKEKGMESVSLSARQAEQALRDRIRGLQDAEENATDPGLKARFAKNRKELEDRLKFGSINLRKDVAESLTRHRRDAEDALVRAEAARDEAQAQEQTLNEEVTHIDKTFATVAAVGAGALALETARRAVTGGESGSVETPSSSGGTPTPSTTRIAPVIPIASHESAAKPSTKKSGWEKTKDFGKRWSWMAPLFLFLGGINLTFRTAQRAWYAAWDGVLDLFGGSHGKGKESKPHASGGGGHGAGGHGGGHAAGHGGGGHKPAAGGHGGGKKKAAGGHH